MQTCQFELHLSMYFAVFKFHTLSFNFDWEFDWKLCCIAKTASLQPDAWQMHPAVSWRGQNPSLPVILQLLPAKQYSNCYLRCSLRLAHLKKIKMCAIFNYFFSVSYQRMLRKPFSLPQFSWNEADISMSCSNSLFHGVKFQHRYNEYSGCCGYTLKSSLPQAVA